MCTEEETGRCKIIMVGVITDDSPSPIHNNGPNSPPNSSHVKKKPSSTDSNSSGRNHSGPKSLAPLGLAYGPKRERTMSSIRRHVVSSSLPNRRTNTKSSVVRITSSISFFVVSFGKIKLMCADLSRNHSSPK